MTKILLTMTLLAALTGIFFLFEKPDEGHDKEPPTSERLTIGRSAHFSPEETSRSSIRRDTENDDLAHIKTLLNKNPQEALTLIASMHENNELGELAEFLPELIIDRFSDSEFTIEETAKLLRILEPIPDVLHVAGNRLFSHWLKTSPQETNNWLLQQKDHPVALSVIDWYAAVLAEGEQTRELASTLLPQDQSPVQNKLLGQMLESWIVYSPEEALDFMQQHDDRPVFDLAIQSYVNRNVETDPKTTMLWAEAISEETKRHSSMHLAAQVWKHQDPEAYQQWHLKAVEKNPALKEALKDSALNR